MKNVITFLLFAILLLGCRKDKHNTVCHDGTIEWHGHPAADGLGWVLATNEETPQLYVLKNLSSDYQHEGLQVSACLYDTGEKVSCLCSKNYFKTTTIRRR
jgi:hypothetical protein